MAQQQEITKFFQAKRKMPQEGFGEFRKRISVRPMSELCKTPVKIGRPNCNPSPRKDDSISLLSSDEDQENCIDTASSAVGAVPASKSDSSLGTSNMEILGFQTPKKLSPASVPGSRSPLSKFFSPTKKRSVKKKSPNKPASTGAFAVTPKKLFPLGDALLSEACAGQDDKTQFLLNIVHKFVKDDSLSYLVGEEGYEMLRDCLRVRGAAPRLICRLYWRKERWYRSTELLKIIDGKEKDAHMFKELLQKRFLVEGSSQNMDIEDYKDGLLKSDDMKNICKFLKIKSQSKKDSWELIESYCKSKNSITNYFGRQNIATNTNKDRVLNQCRVAAGECYKMSDACRSLLYRVHLLSYLGMDADILRTKQLELQLINVKTGRETFPVDPGMEVDKPSLIFPTKFHFESYMTAHFLYEEFLQTTVSAKKISIVQQAYTLYKELDIEECRLLAPWLCRFTPSYIYIKIMEEGISELKKGKDPTLCQLAADILTNLLNQDLFRQHKVASWFDEKALILQNYLHQPDLSAKVMLEAFASSQSDESKELLRPRARKLATQKNIRLDETLKTELLGHATKEYITESSLPSVHFYKQAMDNTTKGKVLFESRHEDGRTISSVENVAISCYIEKGEYTHGRHYEGRIVNTLFFLLFWDIIYSKPKDVNGIFLCHYQRYPLDMFYGSFYESRKSAIDERLERIGTWSVDELVQRLGLTWTSRPAGEQGGILREIGWEVISAVARCLRAAGVAAICRRLAQQYRYAHSGFPDLTLWNPHTGKIMFAEVKSDSDKPSLKQMQWMRYLLDHGIHTEFCYVGTRGPHTSNLNQQQIV